MIIKWINDNNDINNEGNNEEWQWWKNDNKMKWM